MKVLTTEPLEFRVYLQLYEVTTLSPSKGDSYPQYTVMVIFKDGGVQLIICILFVDT